MTRTSRWASSTVQGNSHAYEYSSGALFHRIHVPGAVSSTASGINNRGDIAGFYTGRGGVVRASCSMPSSTCTV